MASTAGLGGWGRSRPTSGFDPRTVQPVKSRYTVYAMPALNYCLILYNIYTVYKCGSWPRNINWRVEGSRSCSSNPIVRYCIPNMPCPETMNPLAALTPHSFKAMFNSTLTSTLRQNLALRHYELQIQLKSAL